MLREVGRAWSGHCLAGWARSTLHSGGSELGFDRWEEGFFGKKIIRSKGECGEAVGSSGEVESSLAGARDPRGEVGVKGGRGGKAVRRWVGSCLERGFSGRSIHASPIPAGSPAPEWGIICPGKGSGVSGSGL